MKQYQYQVGGSLAVDAVCYVEREADSQLYRYLLQGECCYILTSRQMGKSSLLVQTFYRLKQESYRCAIIDLTTIGSEQITPLQWYKGTIAQICFELGLKDISWFKDWWREREDFSYLQILSRFIDELLSVHFPTERIFIFIDEIDTILSLGFNVDDFFALIRYCHEKRTVNPNYQRITFTLAGVATPSDLIRDKSRTPFNIGKAINLENFQFNEVKPLLTGLKDSFGNPEQIMQAIIKWTGGQPFLTQKLCQLIVSNSQYGLAIFKDSESSYVDNLVKRKIINNWESQDEPEHFRTIRDRLLRKKKLSGRLLGIYQKVLARETVKADDSREHIELFLSGLIIKQDGYLKIKNLIYQKVFNLEWVEKQLQNLRPYSQTFQAWIASKKSDESRLLKGKALQNALLWSQGKSLSDLDYQFLAASQEADRKEVQKNLEAARLKEVQTRLIETEKRREQEQKANRLQKWLLTAVSGGFLISSGLGILAFRQYRQAIQNEVKALISSSDALFASNRNLDALVEAIKAKKQLIKISRNQTALLSSQIERVLKQSIYRIREFNRLSDNESTVNAISFSPDGKFIVSGGGDSSLKFWQKNGKQLQTIKAHDGVIWDVAMAHDGVIATAGSDNVAKLWTSNGKELQTLSHQAVVWDVAFSSDGKIVASASGDKTVKLWNREGALLATFAEHQKEVYAVAFSPDDKIIASASGDKTVKLWTLNGDRVTLLQTLIGHSDRVYGVTFSSDGKTIATASWDKTIKLWQFDPITQSYRETKTLTEHTDAVNRIVFSPDGKYFASTSWDSTVKIWQADGTLNTTLKANEDVVHGVAFSPDSKTLVSSGWSETIKLWQVNTPLLQTLEAHQAGLYQVRFSPDGNIFATASRDNTVKLWHKTGKLLATITEYQDTVFGVDFSPDGKILATTTWDGKIYLWQPTKENWQQPKLIRQLQGHSDRVFSVAFSPDGKMLASASGDNTVKIWQIDSNSQIELLHTLKKHQDEVYGIAFSPNGKLIASASLDGTVKLWNNDGTFKQTLRENQNTVVVAVAFSPDGKLIASGSLDGKVKLWNSDGTLVHTLTGDKKGVFDLAFSADGKYLASAGLNNVIKVWQYREKSKPESIVLNAHQGEVMGIDFSPDSKTIASSSQDLSVILWDLEKVINLDELAYACNLIRDYLQHNAEVEKSDRSLCNDVRK